MTGMVLSQRLAVGLGAPGGRRPKKGVCRGWRLVVRWDLPGGHEAMSFLFEDIAPDGGT